MTWPRRPEHGRVARVGAHLLAVVAVLLAVCGPAAAQSPDPAPPASGPAPDPAPQAAPAPAAPAPAAPAPAAPAPAAPAPAAPAPAQAAPPAPAPVTEPAPAPAAIPAAKPPRRERAKRRRSTERQKPARPRPRPVTFGVTAIPASVTAPRLVIERGGQLATAEARLAALALLVAAAGSLGLIGHLRRETPA